MSEFLWGLLVAILSLAGVSLVIGNERRKATEAQRKAREAEYANAKREAEKRSKEDPLDVVIDRVTDNLDRSRK